MIYLTLILAFFAGFWMREVLDKLKLIIKLLERVRSSEPKSGPTPSTFAGEMTKAELVAMMEEERVAVLNK